MPSPLLTGLDDPFADLVKEHLEMEKQIRRTETKETPLYGKGSLAPTLVGATIAGSFTYGTGNLVEWTRIGNRLFINGRVDITATATAPTGTLTINTFPFAGVADTNMAIAGVMNMEWRNVDLPAGFTSISLQFANGTAAATLIRSGDNVASAAVDGTELTGGVYDFRFGGNYRIF